jgi:hypothetical protein
MKRRIETYGKNGVLEIIGNPLESILFMRGIPIQYSWYAERGTTMRYHLVKGIEKGALHLTSRMDDSLKRGIKSESDFMTISDYFNQLFLFGTYEYGCYEVGSNGASFVLFPESNGYSGFESYGGMLEYTATQSSICDDIVDNYKEQILRGSRPIVVLLHVENSWMFYVIDGHHKLSAYRKANIEAHAMIITKIGNEYKSLDETIELAKSMNCTNMEYLNWMKKEKEDLSYYRSQTLDLDKTFRLIKN